MMHLDRTYELAEEDALSRLHALADCWSKEPGVGSTWEGNEVSISGPLHSLAVVIASQRSAVLRRMGVHSCSDKDGPRERKVK